MKNLKVEDQKCTFELDAQDYDFANAIRRALISDIRTYAPSEVTFTVNTSCQTDEYIAHRIGLIPFLPTKEDELLNLKEDVVTFSVQNKTFNTEDLHGTFKSSYDVSILKLKEGQQVEGTIHFTQGEGKRHARFCPVSAVGYEIKESCIFFTFETINGQNPLHHLVSACNQLQSHLQNVKVQVEKGAIDY
jgi:DNA-directed RNA polymerase alpha subunit